MISAVSAIVKAIATAFIHTGDGVYSAMSISTRLATVTASLSHALRCAGSRPRGIRVVGIAPGLVETPLTRRSAPLGWRGRKAHCSPAQVPRVQLRRRLRDIGRGTALLAPNGYRVRLIGVRNVPVGANDRRLVEYCAVIPSSPLLLLAYARGRRRSRTKVSRGTSDAWYAETSGANRRRPCDLQ